MTVCVGINPHETEQGLEDDRPDALNETLIEAYVNTVSELVTWREANTPVVFETCYMSEYHPDTPDADARVGR